MSSPISSGLPRLPLPKAQVAVAAPSTAASTPNVPAVFSAAMTNLAMQAKPQP